MQKILLSWAMTSSFACASSHHQPSQLHQDDKVAFVAADEKIAQLNEALKEIKEMTTLPVVFPSEIPVLSAEDQKNPYFLSWTTSPDGKRYSISIDKTRQCNGAKYCSVGIIYGAQGQKPQLERSEHDGKIISEEVKLNEKTSAYFTPAHAKADYWPAMVEWSSNDDILYHIAWQVPQKNEKKILLNLAQTALKSASASH